MLGCRIRASRRMSFQEWCGIEKQLTHGVLPAQEVADLAVEAKREDERFAEWSKNRLGLAPDCPAKSRLIAHHQRLIFNLITKTIRNPYPFIEDFMQAGNVGLLRALAFFDPSKNVKFTYYSQYWILLHINKEKHIRCKGKPVLKGTNATALYRYLRLMKTACPSPSLDEAFRLLEADMKRLKVSFDMFSSIVRNFEAETWTVEFDDRLLENKVLEDMIDKEKFNETIKFVNALSERDHYIVSRSFGIDCEKETLIQIGSKFGISKERVRQLRDIQVKEMSKSLSRFA